MPITFKHVSGPLAGKEQAFGDDIERIVLGRDPSLCDIVYPPDLTIVGREHCALIRKISGDYAVNLFGEHYVEVAGEPAISDEPISKDALIALGRDTGPSFTITIDRSAMAHGLVNTSDQQKTSSVWALSKQSRAFAILALVLVVGGLGWQAWEIIGGGRQRAEILAQIADLAAQQKISAAEQVPLSVREHLAASVYAVVLRNATGGESLLGTAWAVGPDVLATNAHVAREIKTLKSGESMLVRPSGASDVANIVTSVTVHPGYDALDHFLSDDALLLESYGGLKRFSSIGGYDVALLHIDGTIPSGSILQVAGPEDLAKLVPGTPLAYAGFPYENIAGADVQAMGRSPQIQVGNVTALTDYFLLPASQRQRRLVQHNLPTTGGGSGSPIVNVDGKVVALLSAINLVMVGNNRTPSAAEINYGQRVDALQELLDGHADLNVEADKAYWAQQTSAFKKGADLIIASVLDEVKPEARAKAVLVTKADTSLDTADRLVAKDKDGNDITIRYKLYNLTLEPSSHHFMIAYGKGFATIAALDLMEGGKIVQRDAPRDAPWAGFNFEVPADGQVTVVVETADTDINIILQDYVWQLPAT